MPVTDICAPARWWRLTCRCARFRNLKGYIVAVDFLMLLQLATAARVMALSKLRSRGQVLSSVNQPANCSMKISSHSSRKTSLTSSSVSHSGTR